MLYTSTENGSALWGRVGQRPSLLLSVDMACHKGIRQLDYHKKDGKCYTGEIPLGNPRYVAALREIALTVW